MSRKLFLAAALLGLLVLAVAAGAQQWPSKLSKSAQITLLTVSPGTELYSAFGHSALRVFDPAQNLDMVFNYGAFRFAPTVDFYWRFVRGGLDYLLSVYSYSAFLDEYTHYNRSVTQQFLELSDTQKNKIYLFLLENNLPENRAYRYDFFYDNCSSRIRDIFERQLKNDINWYPSGIQFNKTYRGLVHEYTSIRPWVDLGITFVLGYSADRQADGRGYMFLPDYMMSAFDSATTTVDGRHLPLVKRKELVLQQKTGHLSVTKTGYLQQPTAILWLALSPLLILSIKDMRRQTRTGWVDSLTYAVAGFGGLFLLFSWFGTYHIVLSWNFNLIWAFPAHIIAPLLIIKARRVRWIRVYFLIFSTVATLILINWFWLPQPLHAALAPLILLLALRGVIIYRYAVSHAA